MSFVNRKLVAGTIVIKVLPYILHKYNMYLYLLILLTYYIYPVCNQYSWQTRIHQSVSNKDDLTILLQSQASFLLQNQSMLFVKVQSGEIYKCGSVQSS